MSKIKICGLRTLEDVHYTNQVQPDYAGFIFVPGRRRCITPQTARELRSQLSPEIASVGVFWDAPLEELLSLAGQNLFTVIQLHGNEDAAYIQALKASCPFPVVKAFSIRSAADVEQALGSPADYLLFDNGKGGTGQSFDWSLLGPVGKPFFLAGGLNASNVADAITHLSPYAVDTSSGVETDGKKDLLKMQAFVQAVRSLS